MKKIALASWLVPETAGLWVNECVNVDEGGLTDGGTLRATDMENCLQV
jgi:hypothetical protein